MASVYEAHTIRHESQFILGTCACYERYQDSVLLDRLRRQAKTYATKNLIILADAGFDGRQIQDRDIISLKNHILAFPRSFRQRAYL